MNVFSRPFKGVSFLRTTKTETTQQRVWCSTGIRYKFVPHSAAWHFRAVGPVGVILFVSPLAGLCGCSFDNPCVLYSELELEHRLDSVPGYLSSSSSSLLPSPSSFCTRLWCVSAICCPTHKVLCTHVVPPVWLIVC